MAKRSLSLHATWRSNFRWLALATVLLLLSACGRPATGTHGIGPVDTLGNITTTSADSSQPQSKSAVRKMQLVTATTGWALTDKRLLWTTNTGRDWSDVKLPKDVSPANVLNAFFLDEEHGWLVLMPSPGTTPTIAFSILSTSDGGKNWKEAMLTFPTTEYTNPPTGDVSIDFADVQHGWMMARLQSSSAFSVGALFATQDGGTTWAKVAAPGGEAIHFSTASNGWTTNSVEGKLYVTHDGGQQWSPVMLALPATQAMPTYDLPTFFGMQDGVLPVTISGEQSAIHFFVSHDGGTSWNLASTVQAPKAAGFGVTIPTAIHSKDAWMVILPGGKIRKTKDDGNNWQDVSGTSIPDSITKLNFATPDIGWAQRTNGTCARFKSQCSTQTEILTTTDGGQAWTSILSLSTSN